MPGERLGMGEQRAVWTMHCCTSSAPAGQVCWAWRRWRREDSCHGSPSPSASCLTETRMPGGMGFAEGREK